MLRRSRLPLDQAIVAPRVQQPTGPVCLTCGRTVDSEQLVEGYPGQTTFARVLVRHHGAEELGEFDMGSTNWDERDLGPKMQARNWFDPRSLGGAGLGQKPRGVVERDLECADRAPMIDVP